MKIERLTLDTALTLTLTAHSATPLGLTIDPVVDAAFVAFFDTDAEPATFAAASSILSGVDKVGHTARMRERFPDGFGKDGLPIVKMCSCPTGRQDSFLWSHRLTAKGCTGYDPNSPHYYPAQPEFYYTDATL